MRYEIERWWARLQLNTKARIRLYRKIATLLSNGLPLLRVLEELHLRESDGGRKPNEALAIVLADWKRTVQNGRMLSEAMRGWVPADEQMIIMAGEQAGKIETALNAVVGVVESARRIRAAIVGGLVYPAAILSLVLTYLYLFGTKVIPEFGRIADPQNWRGTAKSMHLMSQFVQSWMPLIVALLVLLFVAVLVSMPRWRGSLRASADRLPPYSIYRLVVGSSFLMAFSALQQAGMTVEKCLSRMREGASPWLRERIDGALLGVKSGLNCGEALRNAGYGFPAKDIVDDLCIYAQFRGFSQALQMLADEWMAEGVATISSQMKVLNGFAICVLALSIAWLVTGFFGIQQEIAAMTRMVR
jgi:type II secretory pathway component PulF